MKTISILSIILFNLIQLQANSNYPTAAEPCTLGVCIYFSGEIGIKTQNCKKIGLSCLELSFGVTSESRNFNNPPPTGTMLLLTKISNTQLEIAFRTNETGPMVIDMPLALGSTISKALGASNITIKPGSYPTSKRSDGAYTSLLTIY